MVNREVVSEYIVENEEDGSRKTYDVDLRDVGVYVAHERGSDEELMQLTMEARQENVRPFTVKNEHVGDRSRLYLAFLANTAFQGLVTGSTPTRVVTVPENEASQRLLKETLGLYRQEKDDPFVGQDSRVANGQALAIFRRYNAKRVRFVPGSDVE